MRVGSCLAAQGDGAGGTLPLAKAAAVAPAGEPGGKEIPPAQDQGLTRTDISADSATNALGWLEDQANFALYHSHSQGLAHSWAAAAFGILAPSGPCG